MSKMRVWRLPGLARLLLLLVLGAGWMGCEPAGDSAADEERDPHFLDGQIRKRAMDYAGAAEAFERALQNNPRSAAAHFELGLLCYEKLNDWAGAIYHFERFRRLRPNSNRTEAVRPLIMVCKQELAKDVPLGSLSQQMQAELERLVQTNRFLLQEVERLKIQLAQRPVLPPPGTNGAGLKPTNSPGPVDQGGRESRPPGWRPPAAGALKAESPTNRASAGRTHLVKAGETPYSIARSYGVPLNALLAANPGLDPKRLRPGQTLNVPSP
jgi:tetratricopeptide (TPR) repeat protein